jgi:subtilisin family serine protease
MKQFFYSIFLVLICIPVFSQTKSLNGKTVSKKEGKWFTSEGFAVNQVITVKVKADAKTELPITGKVLRTNSLGFTDIELPANVDVIDYVQTLQKEASIESVDFNGMGRYGVIPNDTHFATLQWYLNRIGMPAAWDLIMGTGSCVRVGVLDSGIDWMHEDIGPGTGTYQNIFLHPGEDAWANPNNPTTGNNIDDDGDGYIDNWKGWNFVNNNNNSRSSNTHGTHVAGIISAKTNNSTGISGIAGGNNASGVQLIPVMIGDLVPSGDVIDDAILYAVQQGARVIQMSLIVPFSTAIEAAISTAVANNVIVICASGNSNGAISYPASNANVISVGATDMADQRASFSNYGSNLTVSAPGVSIQSTQLSNGYGALDGTSFAAPQVSAIVALMLAINPGLTATGVKNILLNTSDRVGGYSYTGGRCNELGYGRINALKCIQAAFQTTISGDGVVCTSKSYTLTGLPAGSTFTWSSSPSAVASITTTSSGATVTKLMNGMVEIQPTINTSCGTYKLPAKKLAIGIPLANFGSIKFNDGIPRNPLPACKGDAGRGVFEYTDEAGNRSPLNGDYDFDVVDGTQYSFFKRAGNYGHSYDYELNPTYTGTLHVPVYVENSCGLSTDQFILDIDVSNCFMAAYSVSPNPAINIVTVTAKEPSSITKSSNLTVPSGSFRVNLLDGNGKLQRSVISNNTRAQFDISSLPNGIYILRMERGKEVTTEKLIIRR